MYLNRETLGQWVRAAWAAYCKELPNPKPEWLLPWDECPEWTREVDRRIGEFVALKIREEESQNLCGRHPIYHWLDRTIEQEIALTEIVGMRVPLLDWAGMVGRELIIAAGSAEHTTEFTRRMIRVAAYAVFAVMASEQLGLEKSREALRGSYQGQASDVAFVDDSQAVS